MESVTLHTAGNQRRYSLWEEGSGGIQQNHIHIYSLLQSHSKNLLPSYTEVKCARLGTHAQWGLETQCPPMGQWAEWTWQKLSVGNDTLPGLWGTESSMCYLHMKNQAAVGECGLCCISCTCKEEKEYMYTFLVQKVNITRVKENLKKIITYREGRNRSQVSLKVPLYQWFQFKNS